MKLRSLYQMAALSLMTLVVCLGITSAQLSAASKAWAGGKYKEIRAKLPQKIGGDWSTPTWVQPKDAKGYPVGCGPTAWAIAYGYWSYANGKTRLFNGYDIRSHRASGNSSDPQIYGVMQDVAKDTKTDYYIPKTGVVKGKKSGGTKTKEMCQGIKYAKQVGYNHSRCFRVRGAEYNKFDHVARYLNSGRPVILSMHDDPEREDTRGSINHFVVIEEAVLKQKKVAGKWRDRDVRYVINDGNNSRREITVREKGVNQSKVYSSFSMYFFTVSDKPLPGSADINQEACLEWCQHKSGCKQCSKLPGCGVGYKPLKKFTGAGPDWYACQKRKSYSQASDDHKTACEEWCKDHGNCAKCSEKVGCGMGYKTIKSWTGKGKNWHACQKR